MLNLPEKTAKRDIIHGVKHLEEIAEDWLCARRTLCILSVLTRKWNVDLPEEAAVVLQRADEKWGTVSTSDVPSPNRSSINIATPSPKPFPPSPSEPNHYSPAGHFSQPTPPQLPQDMATSAMSPDLLDAMVGIPSLSTPPTMQSQVSKPMTHAMPTASMAMNDGLLGVNSWAMPVSQTMPAAFTAFTPIQNSIGSPRTSQSGTRRVSPNSLYAVDGQEFFLKDGVNWQQNFELWGLSQSQARSGVPSMADQSMYMFRGVGPELDTTFDSLNSSVANLDHLPGLD
jgi:hypothetical protein